MIITMMQDDDNATAWLCTLSWPLGQISQKQTADNMTDRIIELEKSFSFVTNYSLQQRHWFWQKG